MGLVAVVEISPSACEVDVSVVGLGCDSDFTGGETTAGLGCGSGFAGGGVFICIGTIGELAGVGKLDLRCSSSSGMGEGMGNGTLGPETAIRGRGDAVLIASCVGRAVVELAVEEPETDEGGDDSRLTCGTSNTIADDSLPSLVGEFTTLGGLTLAASALPLRSRPRSLSSLPILRPRSRPFAYAPLAATPSARAEPVGDKLPMGELVPRLLERSRSESEALRVSERPRDSERESVEREYELEPVVVDPLTEPHVGDAGSRPRHGLALGESRVASATWGENDICGWFVPTRGTATGAVWTNVGGCVKSSLPIWEGLVSRDRSVRSSVAPLTSFTTTTGVSGLWANE